MKINSLLVGLTVGLLIPVGVRAQAAEVAAGSPFSVGGNLFTAQPDGEFGSYVDRGFGLAGHLLVSPGPGGILGLRLEGGFVNYGRETKRVPLSSTIGGRVEVDVATMNNIVFVGIGPQLTFPGQRLQPYAHGSVGFSYFFTESSVDGIWNHQTIARSTNFDDLTFSYGGGAGLLIPVYRGVPVISLDLGVRYLANGETRYLREGSIVDLPDGTISVEPILSQANFFTYYVGASVRIPQRRPEL